MPISMMSLLKNYVIAVLRWLELLVMLSSRATSQRWPTLIAIVEPAALIIVIAAIHDYSGTHPPFGDSTVMFYSTGLLPYYLFLNVSMKAQGIDFQKRLPRVSRLDYALSYVVGELFLKIAMFLGIFGVLYAWGVPPPLPRNPIDCFVPLLAISLFGLAIGIINKVLIAFWQPWYYIELILLRVMMLLSCVHYVMDVSPPVLREITVYNPLAQAITWFRREYYYNYPTMLLDLSYLINFIAISLALAFLLDSSTRAYRRII